ncbi:bacterial extracellular solute-binding protein, family 7 domain-containing protein [Ditylenchus destructor]|nr:bacterial extracellular solute-binding protein, family 7 domain-containing protein [Ditylenchus destructor]
MYRQTTPQFSEHFFDNDGDDSLDQGPTGGFAWDGRAASAHEQAEAPLLSPFEMANADRGAVVARMKGSANAALLRQSFGPHVFDDAGLAWNAMVLALEVFQQSPKDFAPFSSRYDAYLRGKGVLTPAEARGLALFEGKDKGNCASCHPSAIKRGAMPVFTDMGHIAIGVPRNGAIPANRDASFHDLGTCDAVAAQRGDAAGVLPQRGRAFAGGGRALLCAAGHESGALLSARRQGPGAGLRRPAGEVPGQPQQRGAVRRQARRQALAQRAGDPRPGRLPEDAGRRGGAVTPGLSAKQDRRLHGASFVRQAGGSGRSAGRRSGSGHRACAGQSALAHGLELSQAARHHLWRRRGLRQEGDELSGGKFQISVHAGGELMPAFGVVDGVQNGTVEIAHTVPYYFFGKDETFAIGASIPFGLNSRQMTAWTFHGNGLKLMREFYRNYNIINFPGGNTGAQMAGWYRKEIKSAADFKGLKFRIGGFAGRVIERYGRRAAEPAGRGALFRAGKGHDRRGRMGRPGRRREARLQQGRALLLLSRLVGRRSAGGLLPQHEGLQRADAGVQGDHRSGLGLHARGHAGQVRRGESAGAQAAGGRGQDQADALPQGRDGPGVQGVDGAVCGAVGQEPQLEEGVRGLRQLPPRPEPVVPLRRGGLRRLHAVAAVLRKGAADSRRWRGRSGEEGAVAQQQYPVEAQPDFISKLAGAKHRKSFRLSDIRDEGEVHEARLEIVEWSELTPASLFLCNAGRDALVRAARRFDVGDFQFTAYLESSYLGSTRRQGAAELAELQPAMAAAIDESRAGMSTREVAAGLSLRQRSGQCDRDDRASGLRHRRDERGQTPARFRELDRVQQSLSTAHVEADDREQPGGASTDPLRGASPAQTKAAGADRTAARRLAFSHHRIGKGGGGSATISDGLEALLFDAEPKKRARHRRPDALQDHAAPSRETVTHLVVELKAPRVKLDREEISQIEGYAASVVADERFRGVDAQWRFWAISDDLGPVGQFRVGDGDGEIVRRGNVAVYLKTWAQVIDENRSRLQFYQEKLEFQADKGVSLKHLREHYAKYLEGVLVDAGPASQAAADALDVEPVPAALSP